MYCKDCKCWERWSDSIHGHCYSDKIIDGSKVEIDEPLHEETLEYDCDASFTTGEKFGCIHFEKKVNE